MGSGAGLPGLVLAHDFPDVTWWLIERAVARADWLRRAVRRLGLANVTIAPLAAQAVGRSEERGRFDVVVARSFAAPLIVAECAAPLLVVGGRLVVSDRSGEDRWPAAELDRFGLAVGGDRLDGARRLRWFRQIRRCPDRYPRASLRRR